MTETKKIETFADFLRAVRDASESPTVDYGLRVSEDFIKLTLFWIAQYRPELLEEALTIVYRADEGVNRD